MNSVSFHGNNNNKTTSEECNVKDNEKLSDVNNSIFFMKLHQKKSYLSDKSGHEVIFNVTFAMAVPGIFTTKQNDSFSTRNSSIDQSSRNIQQFFHLEFDLFSKDITKENFKTEIGFYGSFAKIYPDKSESKVIPTWSDGEDTWISWIQQFKYWITDKHIRSLCSHKMKILIWDTKEKCLPKVRFDRPKAPKSASRSKSTNENISWIKQTVLMLSKNYATTSAFKEDSDRVLPHQIVVSQLLKRNIEKSSQLNKSAKNSSTAKSSISSPELKLKENEQLVLLAEPKSDVNSGLESYGILEKLLEPIQSSTVINFQHKYHNSPEKTKPSATNVKESLDIPLSIAMEPKLRSESRKSMMDNEKYNKNGRIGFDINMADLFLKNDTFNRIPNSIITLEDMFCQINIESDLLSINQKKNLNPLVIKIKKIRNFPIDNEKIDEINKKYKPLYFQYKFSDKVPYNSLCRLHKPLINFDDVSIVLLGEMSSIKIREQMLNSFFIIQLFNRLKHDNYDNETNIQTNISDTNDDRDIGDIGYTSSLKTVTEDTIPIPSGEAKIDLSDIITKNLKFMEITVPIIPVSTITLKQDNENRTKQYDEDQVNFLESETTIKISFQLAERLCINLINENGNEFYTRLVIINNNLNCNFIREACGNFILKFNCQQLGFKNDDVKEMKKFLYSKKNSIFEDNNNDDYDDNNNISINNKNKTNNDTNNLFNGFYIHDKQLELIFIEGTQSIMKTLYEECSIMMNNYCQMEEYITNLKLLYNDSLLFQDKGNFEILTMIPLMLSKDISFFVSQPLLYVRDILPKNCVEAICRLNELILSDSMQVVVRNNLIPTNEMMRDLSQYLCSYIDSKSENEVNNFSKEDKKIKITTRKFQRTQIKTAPAISNRKSIANDIDNQEIKRNKTYIYSDKECEFSYSSQSKNSISSALKEIRNQMDPKRRYTFCQDYLFSGNVDPVDIDDIYLADERKIKFEPKWIHKGFRTTIDDYSENFKIPINRTEDLKEPWKENQLHTSFMEPTLPERDKTDFHFDTYIRPLHLLERDSISVMPSYIIQKNNEKQKSKMDYYEWKNKICVSDPKFKTHRLLIQTELLERGRQSSNQISKLNGLRKDNLNLINWVVKKQGDPNAIPAISVLPSGNIVNLSYTVGSEMGKNLLVNYIPINKKDKDFKSVYQPNKDNPIYKNLNPKIPLLNSTTFSSIRC